MLTRNSKDGTRAYASMKASGKRESKNSDHEEDEDEDKGEEENLLKFDDVIEEIGFGPSQLRVIAVVGLVLAMDAVEMMLLSFLGPSVLCDFGISHEEEAMLTTVVFIGMLIGANLCGWFADRYGRRRVLFALSGFTFVFGVASALVSSFEQLLFLRGCVGVCLGGTHIAFAYVMEFLPVTARGRWSILLELFWSLGTFAEALIAWVLYETGEQKGAWRSLLFVSSLPAAVAWLLLYCEVVPVSPRYLAARGDYVEAYSVLRQVARGNGVTLPTNGKLAPFRDSPGKAGLGTMKALGKIFSRSLLLTSILLWLLWLVNSFVYYGLVLMSTSLAVTASSSGDDDANESFCDPVTNSPFHDSSVFQSVLSTTIAELPGTLLAAYLVDKIGRKKSQAGCFAGVGIALCAMFFTSRSSDPYFLFVARALVMGSFVITYLYTPEVYPTPIRATAFGLANSFGRLGGMVAPFIGEDLVERGHRKQAIFIFASAAIGATIASVLLPIETQGKALDDVSSDSRDNGGEFESIDDAFDPDVELRPLRSSSMSS